jgi:hypothetical protein
MTVLRQPFASVLQLVLIVLLILSGVLIVQQWSLQIYQIGLVLLVATTLLQIGAGNIPPDAGVGRSLGILIISLTIVALVFGLGIVLVPYLVGLGGR